MTQRHEIVLLNGSLAVAANTDYAFAVGETLASSFNGTLTGYLEILYNGTSLEHRLLRTNDGTTMVSVTGGTSGSNLLLVSSTFSFSTDFLYQYETGPGGSGTVKSIKFIILQDTGINSLTSCENQYEIGSRETGKINTTAAGLVAPKYWKYVASNFDGIPTFFVDLTWSLSGTGTGTITLQESSATLTAPTWTDKLTIVSGGISATPSKTRSATFTPVDGRMYRISTANSSSMGSLGIYLAKIICTQLQGSEAYYLSSSNPVFTLSGNSLEWAVGQSFTPTANTTITSIGLVFGISVGSPTDSVVVEVLSGSITGTVLTSGTISGTSITGGAMLRYISLTSVSLTSGVKYYIRITRSGASDSSNNYYFQGLSTGTYTGGALIPNSGNTNSNWGVEGTIDLAFIFPTVEITKVEEHYLIANTTLVAGTALQGFLTKWDSTQWSGVTNTYYHEAYASDGNTSVVELDTAAGVQVTGSSLSTIDNISKSGAITMPANGNLDTKATTNSGSVYGNRIIVASVKSAGSAVVYRRLTLLGVG